MENNHVHTLAVLAQTLCVLVLKGRFALPWNRESWRAVLRALGKKRGKKIRKKQKRRISHKVRIKRAVKKAAKTIWKHLVEIPEKEREQNLATIGRMVKRKLKWRKSANRK
jgi:hypothetical protein